ncbi:ABC transporter substrate-binding protein [bacterium]|nr:ABC transporter substrate-binding protein [bacterium]
MRPSAVILTLCAALGTGTAGAATDPPQRLVTIGGDVTEIVYALGAGDHVVGADTSSVHPPATAALPKIGYQRQLSAEGVLALRPTLILASDQAGPPAALDQLRAAGVRVDVIPTADSADGAANKIAQVAARLDRAAEGERLIAAMRGALAAAERERAVATSAPRVLFVYARAGSLAVAGRDTGPDAMIRLAGGRNAVAEIEGFKALTSEAVVAAAPDVLLMLSRGVDAAGGAAAIWTQPGLAQTPAGQARRLVVMDDLYLLGFGPRLGDAVRDLGRHLHPEVAAR